MKTNKEKYQQAFSVLHAADNYVLTEKKRIFTGRFAAEVAVMLILILTFAFSYNVYAYTNLEIRVFMEEHISQQAVERIEKEITHIRGVQSVKYVSGDDAWEEFQKAYLTEEQAAEFTENPLQNSQNFQVRVLKSVDRNQLQRDVEQIEGVRRAVVE